MSRRKEIVKDAGIYTASSYLAQIFDMANGILVRRFLGPSNMGVWAFLQVIQNYAKHAGLGVTTATARDVPYYLGKGDLAKADHTKNVVFSFAVTTASAVSAGVILYALFRRASLRPEIFWGLIAVAALILLQRVFNLFVVLLRACKEFAFAGALNIASSVSSLVLTLALTLRFGLYGFFVSLALNYVLMTGLILAKTSYRFTFVWDLRALAPLLGLGLSMILMDMLRTVIESIDRIMITRYLGFEALGFYSIALMASNYLYSMPNMLGIIFFPHLQEVFAKRDRHEDLESFLREPALAIAYLFPVLVGLAWVLGAWLVPVLLPKFTPGIRAMKLVALASFFLALTHPFVNFIITVKRHWSIIPLQALSAAFGFAATWAAIRAGWNLSGVALADIALSLCQFLVFSWVSLRTVWPASRMAAFYAKIFGAFLWTSALLFGSDALAASAAGFSRAAFQLFFFGAGMIPLFYFAERECRVLSTLKSLARDFFRRGAAAEAGPA